MDAATFKAFFDRGPFIYGPTVPAIRDSDILKANAEALAIFNADLYPSAQISLQAELYLTAHFLTTDIDAADSGGAAIYQQTSRSAGGVSESVNIPDWMQNGDFALFATTYFGQKFLIISRPYLGGVVLAVSGGTNP